jgi:hypothetical protein
MVDEGKKKFGAFVDDTPLSGGEGERVQLRVVLRGTICI